MLGFELKLKLVFELGPLLVVVYALMNWRSS